MTTVLHIIGVWFAMSAALLMAWVATIEIAHWWYGRQTVDGEVDAPTELYPQPRLESRATPQKPPKGTA
jgi:hypothetical protein